MKRETRMKTLAFAAATTMVLLITFKLVRYTPIFATTLAATIIAEIITDKLT